MADIKQESAMSEQQRESYRAGRMARNAKTPRSEVPKDVIAEYWQFGWDNQNARNV